MVSPFEIVGIIAACLTSTGLFPQAFKGFKTKKADDISWALPIVIIAGTVLWMIYGAWRNDWILFWSSGVAFSSAVLLFIVKAIYGRGQKHR